MTSRLRRVAIAFIAFAAMSVLVPPMIQASDAEASNHEAISSFIVDLGDRAIGALTDKSLAPEVRQERFRKLLNEGLDLDYVARFVLGAYRRRADEQQMDKFKALLEENIVRNYAWRFRNYNGQQLRLLGVRDANRDSTIVETEVEQTGDTPPIRVDWRVHQKDGQYKVIDIVVEGISMMVTQRDEYVGYMRSNGGIDALLEALRKQNAALADRNQG